MQMMRLFETVYLLLEKRSVTAKELAERFGVSARTVYRDIEALSIAGIPVYATRGKGGGIRLSENFVLDRSLLSASEQSEVLAALRALPAEQTDSILNKLGGLFRQSAANWIEIDFSDWSYSDREMFALIKCAILERRLVSFDYYSTSGEKTLRVAEPMMLWFKHKSWYLRAFCLKRNAERLFKLSRVKRLRVLAEGFSQREAVHTEDKPDSSADYYIRLKLRIAPEMLFRVYDEFGESMISQNEDGSFTCEAVFPEDEWVYGYIFSFGPSAEVLEPASVRENIISRLRANLDIYTR